MKKKYLYSYNPSYIYDKNSQYKILTERYDNCFKSFLNKESYNKELFFEAINDMKLYINSSFYFGIYQKYDNKTPIEKIIYAIFYRYSKIIGSIELAKAQIEYQILDLAENSIYYSLGIESYKKRNFKWNNEKTFLKHTINSVFFVLLLEFFRKKEYEFNFEFNNDIQKNNYNNVIELLNKNKFIPRSIKDKLKLYLECDIEYSDLNSKDIKYLEKIYEDYL